MGTARFFCKAAWARAQPGSAGFTVHRVGAFEASFVPSLADLSRLDARFRLSEDIELELERRYADYGFAVFQLAPGDQKVHRMAFHFPTRDPSRIFYPTMHHSHGQTVQR